MTERKIKEEKTNASQIVTHKKRGRQPEGVNVTGIVEGEYAENDVRKDFTPSERVAIAEVVREAIGERRGRDNPQNIVELKGEETSSIAAKRSGFGNETTYRQARTVTTSGTPELVHAMDTGNMLSE